MFAPEKRKKAKGIRFASLANLSLGFFRGGFWLSLAIGDIFDVILVASDIEEIFVDLMAQSLFAVRQG